MEEIKTSKQIEENIVFQKRLIELRGEQTQKYIADKIGITEVSLSRYENGQRKPNLDIIYKIAKYYNVSADYLMGLEIKNFNRRCKALYVGSFDPFTNGHLNVLDHASKIFDKVYICVMANPKKKRFIDVDISEVLIKQIVSERYENVALVHASTTLSYKQAKICDCKYLVRGIRNNGLDYTYEENCAEFNKEVGGINTIFIRADVNKNVSSTMIRTLLSNGEDISKYVPKNVYRYLMEKK